MKKDPTGEDSGRKEQKEKVMELVKSIPVSVYRGNGIGKKNLNFYFRMVHFGIVLARRTRFEEQTLTKVEAKH